ncbi:TPA: DUF2971 domain-containing protein [Yersinia enterocolitica]|uniref:DUF2971 domain-containing protein n=1 Tax=Yersinia enterocolitica TaxID=630 RepID=B0RKZ2_YEREN|nr:DUF2971 domain-containing protein [Yersinia enterocolitica]AKF40332.1 hypothetical protein FORC2_p054 [Yersinia enterocolitica]ALG47335.1 hypothetical protein LI89_22210 [Yersinia enterocolitica]EKN3829036.1 DUF2971 domain-containing protein [Yersinia enterocolitica]EKN3882899.1 DUF2971 domain-containing protein [Yersinia enterocolitica]EKN4012432.1 DUF2971 domain-containing protein [Yersinia enterocolitica]
MIYHYTDLNAAKSITDNSSVWLTDYRFLNDKEEFLEGFNVLCEALVAFNDYSDECTPEFIKHVKSGINLIIESDITLFERNNVFVASFSHTPDLLSQWRSYGMFSLEFNEEFILEGKKGNNLCYLECHYLQNHEDALDCAETLIKENIIPKLLKLWGKMHKALITLELHSLIEVYALAFKHSAFQDEDEVRLVISCADDDVRIKFRIKGCVLIPYIEIEFNPLALNTITIGPIDNQELSVHSLTMFANQASRRVQEEEGIIEYSLNVDYSDIPYRSF